MNKKNILLIIMMSIQANFVLPSYKEKFIESLQQRDFKSAVSLILTSQKNLNVDRPNGDRLFYKLIEYNHVGMVREFIAQGASTTLKDKNGKIADDYAQTPAMKKLLLQEAIDFYNMDNKNL